MRWRSTRGQAPPATFREALFAGLAPDGGLYMPARLEPLSAGTLESLRGRGVAEVGTGVASHLIGDEIARDALGRLIGEALNFDIPLVPVANRFSLELFHGPTFAFKDVGARVMARLMGHCVAPGDSLTVLVATSGDTGSAVAQAFAGVAGTRVVVLYPEGQVSDVQEAQFATIGGNVQAVAVQGTFDDCQALVKAAFGDARLRESAQLTSANSINVGRLLPQTFYYAWGALQQPDAVWSVPSGNFGNLTAGLLAKRLGFPIAQFIAATNVNDVVPEYLASGTYTPRASVRTIANAMDVGAPSNFERIQALYDGSLDRVRADVQGIAFDDAQVTAAIADVHSRHGYVLDPHSAIAWLGLDGRDPPSAIRHPQVFVATAHPAKFRETVEPAIGRHVDLPAALRDALTRPRLVTRIAPRLNELADLLR
jgi:threonine synthase